MIHTLTTRLKVSALAIAAFWAASTAMPGHGQAAELVYFTSEACPVCARWDEEVGTDYHKTDESRTLPLRTVSIHDDKPQDLAFVKGITYTPTFVIVEDGKEVGRMVGYISDYFFWGKLDTYIGQIEAIKAADAKGCGASGADQQSGATGAC